MILNHFFFAAIKVCSFSFWACIFFSEGEGGGG